MKMNNTMGVFDGNSPVILVFADPQSRTGLLSTACGFALMSLLVVTFIHIFRRRAESRNLMAWSPLPVDASDDWGLFGRLNAVGFIVELTSVERKLLIAKEWKLVSFSLYFPFKFFVLTF
ncbi:hypothetical protein Cni_G08858 [Canna indica]|uniref:Uncharacterized protein n=1 Tax=Canna indica TaxID=4628 RepID=A0AAQ3K181_9LILI|nr:hypothetical protein Cni_G08858 [Canna indica]